MIAATFPAGMMAQTSSNTAANDRTFASIDQIMTSAITCGKISGEVVLVGHDGRVVYREAFGQL